MSELTQLTPEALDFLQRAQGPPPAIDRRGPAARGSLGGRMLFAVRGIGVLEKNAPVQPEHFRPVTEDVLVGLHNYRIPLAFELSTDAQGCPRIGLGTWLPRASPPGLLAEHAGLLHSALESLYLTLDLEEVRPAPAQYASGMVLGMPSLRAPDPADGSLGVDRILRSAGAGPWTALVLALPVDEDVTRGQRLRVLNEMREVSGAVLDAGRRPLAEHYLELLELSLAQLTTGQATGMWRTAVYLSGDQASFHRLSTIWRGIYSGSESLLEPLRAHDDPAVGSLIEDWAVTEVGGDAPRHGSLRHPFAHQTVLSATQLAAYVHLPRLETAGFAVSIVPDFDVVPPPVRDQRRSLDVGRVLNRGRQTETNLSVDVDELSSHVFVTGITGSGKTNTVLRLLIQAAELGVPFLVIEPVKHEYRSLLGELGAIGRLQVWTPGNESVAPFRLNPFGFPVGHGGGPRVAVHLDLLRSVFNASFGMWTPLPQVLELCLHEVYQDRGWQLATGDNYRLGADDDPAPAFPTLSELAAKIDEVVPRLGYDDRVTGDIRAALRTRLDGLRSGAKGTMLDGRVSLPIERLLSEPTVVELEGLGDDDDKAFMMGLLLVAIAEHRRVAGPSTSLRHLIVVEEAHRLLGRPTRAAQEGEGDARGKAVETFANLLAEVRAYGQGLVIADQSPSRLTPDVIKNTRTKIVHRIVAGDDREILAAAMSMSEQQQRAIGSLPTGCAAVLTGNADAPLVVRVNQVPAHSTTEDLTDEHVSRSMAARVSGQAGSAAHDRDAFRLRDAARDVVEDAGFARVFARLVQSMLEDAGALDRLWDEIVAPIDHRRPPQVPEAAFRAAVLNLAAANLADRRGAQAGWSYQDTRQFASLLSQALLARADHAVTAEQAQRFTDCGRGLHLRREDPYPACGLVCRQEPKLCLYRAAAGDLIASAELTGAWRLAERQDLGADPARRNNTWQVAQDAGYALIELRPGPGGQTTADESSLRASLCFAQQMLHSERRGHPRNALIAMGALLKEAADDVEK